MGTLLSSWVFRLVVLALFSAALTSFLLLRYSGSPREENDDPGQADFVLVPVEVARTPVLVPALTHDASELRRIAEEHASLLTSLPPTPAPTPTLTVAGKQEVAGRIISSNPEGIPHPTPELQNWFDSETGLVFHREEGGDWTSPGVRGSHPLRELFYYEEYPPDIPNFVDESIYVSLARGLALGASEVLPALGDPNPAVITAFIRRLGWQIRDGEHPVINLWTTFEFVSGKATSVYAVGGVMGLELRNRGLDSSPGDGPVVTLDYLVPGQFIGPVVVQRLETRFK